MNTITEFFLDYKNYIVVIITIGYAVIFKTFLDRAINRKKQRNEKFFKALDSGFDNDSIENYEDVTNIYEGITKMSTEDNEFKYGLKRWLKEYLVNLVSKDNLDKVILKERKIKITDFIRKNEEIAPYDDIPSAEKNLLLDILLFSKENKQDALKRKIDELGGIIKTKNEVLNKIQNSNKYSTIFAIVGLVLTIIFGLLSLY